MQKYLITVLILGSGLLVGQRSAAFAQGDEAFRGKPLPQLLLQPSGSVSCFAGQAAVTGFYRNVPPSLASLKSSSAPVLLRAKRLQVATRSLSRVIKPWCATSL